eukprot:TRINITY_DN49577_c0_g1_i1.p1 TRINITY_DN49577_c0_g1~~TRINITY_DN49577_c0_g1_i1.p1  ORF type:complete len:376 (-),score=33.04 TRINITY_DN49577_c0_g1_i1:193-1320(-)
MASPSASACVIGANGFIGVNSVSALSEHGFSVRAAVRRKSSQPLEWQKNGIHVMEADVTNPASLSKCVEGCDIVINCAGLYRWWIPDSTEFSRVNDEGAGHLARACLQANVRRLVHFSTPMSYGYPRDRPFTETSEPGPHASEYARTKRLGDLRIKSLCEGTSLELVTLYLGCTIGAGDSMFAGRIAAVIRDFIQGKIPLLVGPDTKFIYVHIRDVRKALLAVVDASSDVVSGEDFFIGNCNDAMTTRCFFDVIGKLVGRKVPTHSLNLTIGYWLSVVMTWISSNFTGLEPTAPADVVRTALHGSIEYSCEKSVSVLGLSYTPIDVAISESVADVKRRMAAAVEPQARSIFRVVSFASFFVSCGVLAYKCKPSCA